MLSLPQADKENEDDDDDDNNNDNDSSEENSYGDEWSHNSHRIGSKMKMICLNE